MRVLLVDDHKSVRFMVRELLLSEGCEVSCAADGAKGLASVDRGRPDVVVLDLCMPGIHGSEVLEKLKRQNPGLPVIIYTGSPLEALQGRLSKADACIPKTTDLEPLLQAVLSLGSVSRDRHGSLTN